MFLDKTTESIAYFIGLFHLATDAARARLEYAGFRFDRKDPDLDQLNLYSGNRDVAFGPEGYDPKVQDPQFPQHAKSQAPVNVSTSEAPQPAQVPLAVVVAGVPAAGPLGAAEPDPPVPVVEAPPPSSSVQVTLQENLLSDRDGLDADSAAVAAWEQAQDQMMETLQASAATLQVLDLGAVAALERTDAASAEDLAVEIAAASAAVADAMPEASVSLVTGDASQGVTINGEAAEALPDWQDLLPEVPEIGAREDGSEQAQDSAKGQEGTAQQAQETQSFQDGARGRDGSDGTATSKAGDANGLPAAGAVAETAASGWAGGEAFPAGTAEIIFAALAGADANSSAAEAKAGDGGPGDDAGAARAPVSPGPAVPESEPVEAAAAAETGLSELAEAGGMPASASSVEKAAGHVTSGTAETGAAGKKASFAARSETAGTDGAAAEALASGPAAAAGSGGPAEAAGVSGAGGAAGAGETGTGKPAEEGGTDGTADGGVSAEDTATAGAADDGGKLAATDPVEPAGMDESPAKATAAGEAAAAPEASDVLVTGGNLSVNEATAVAGGVDAPVIAVAGDVVSLDLVSQVNVLKDDSARPGEDNLLQNSAALSGMPKAPAEGEELAVPPGGTSPAPGLVALSTIDGDLINYSWTRQINVAADEDVVSYTDSGAESWISMGGNQLVNAESLFGHWEGFDLILVGGNMVSQYVIQQTNVLLDYDRFVDKPAKDKGPPAHAKGNPHGKGGPHAHEDGTPGKAGPHAAAGGAAEAPASVETAGNVLVNTASITHLAVDEFAGLGAEFKDWLDSFDPDNPDFSGVAKSAHLAAKPVLKVLHVAGDLINAHLVSQVNVLSDGDLVTAAAGSGLEVHAGANATVNSAHLTGLGTDSVVMAGGSVFSDAVLHQANLISGEAPPLDVMLAPPAPDALASEAVAFLADGMQHLPKGQGEEMSVGDSMAVHDGPANADVMQTMLA